MLFPLVLALVLPGCGLFKKKKKPEPQGPKTTVVGIVEMVNPEQNYVLIRCDVVPNLGTGTELVAMDAAGTEAKLKLTQERKGRYLTADIESGQPKVMNLVVRRTRGDGPLDAPVVPTPVPGNPPGGAAPMPLMPTLPAFSLDSVTSPQTPLEPGPSLPGSAPPASPPANPAPVGELEPPIQ
ncbi:hypothetical protein [Prosthecobacter dejongeii]|uniref:hypothetical protein n=1 Tax=Prosthecobacter dejongeii TaxID=48465 RepID=UPI00160DCD3F|nr:hypothetical protein [Prosthecobacter dejongeii]